MDIISRRVAKIKPSPTFAFAAKASELKKIGKDIISLTVGEPDFPTPEHIRLSAIDAINQGKTRYTEVDGIKALKEAITSKFKKDNNLNFALDEVTVGSGGKQVIYNLFMASLNKGDEVIIPAPYWASYPDIVIMAEGEPVIIDCPIQNNFKLTHTDLASYITPKTKWLILNSPNNPTGSVYSHDELLSLAEVLKQHPHVNILSDEIYECEVFESLTHTNIINICPELKERVFIVNGVSKTYSMTGWRIGYGAGDKNLIAAIATLQSQSTSNPCSISQYAALAAIEGPQEFLKHNSDEFEIKRNIALNILSTIEGFEIAKPEGAFYIFPSIKALLNRTHKSGITLKTCTDFAMYLLEESGVGVIPGSAFGAEGHIRISTALSKEDLHEGCMRIKRACIALTS